MTSRSSRPRAACSGSRSPRSQLETQLPLNMRGQYPGGSRGVSNRGSVLRQDVLVLLRPAVRAFVPDVSRDDRANLRQLAGFPYQVGARIGESPLADVDGEAELRDQRAARQVGP